jgi:molybdopterin synthase sulfur carrier subunit
MSDPAGASIRVRVRYFASLREALGEAEEAQVPAGTTAGALRVALAARGGAHAEALAPQRAVRCARNQRMCGAGEPLAEGDELAFFPPVTGG